jgi:tRNA dimethylallyltransferase
VPHHGFDLVDPRERFSAGRFAALARTCIDEIQRRGAVPVLAGGTGFFLRALTNPLFEEPFRAPELKEAVKTYLSGLEPDELRRWAAVLDPEAAARLADRQRLARVIEIVLLTGRTLAWWQRNAPAAAPAIDPRVFVLDLPRDVLYARIDARVDTMIGQGLVSEVRDLVACYGASAPGLNATGYVELIPYLRGERSLDEAAALIRQATRRYARRQTTWLRHQLPPHAVRVDATGTVAGIVDAMLVQMDRNPT